jgi:hypothetical protein
MRQLVDNGNHPSWSQHQPSEAALGCHRSGEYPTCLVCSRRPLRPAMPPPFPPPEAVVKNTDSTSARAFEGAWAALDKSTLLLVALVCANKLFPKPYTKHVLKSTVTKARSHKHNTHADSHKDIHTSTDIGTPAARTERARPSSCSRLVFARLWALRGCSCFNSCMFYLALSPANIYI